MATGIFKKYSMSDLAGWPEGGSDSEFHSFKRPKGLCPRGTPLSWSLFGFLLHSLLSAACQRYSSAAGWQVLVRVMLSTETEQPKASRTHWTGGSCALKNKMRMLRVKCKQRQEQLLGSPGVEGNSGAWTLSCWKQQGWSCLSDRQVSCFPFPSPTVALTFALIYSGEKGFN